MGFEFYERRKANRPSIGTFAANEGGPGYASTASRGYYLGLFRPMAERRDIVIVDQRGTGTSGAIRCPELQQATLPWVKAVTACGQQLGKRSDTYTTAYAADDTAAVLDALGIDTDRSLRRLVRHVLGADLRAPVPRPRTHSDPRRVLSSVRTGPLVARHQPSHPERAQARLLS